jgi:hypothetical protein
MLRVYLAALPKIEAPALSPFRFRPGLLYWPVVAQKSVWSQIGWQVKITTDDVSSVEENIGHGCESGSMHGLWVPVYSSK